MAFDYERIGSRIPVDPRVVEKIQRSPAMMAEQGSFLEAWGGPNTYRTMAGLPEEPRLTYAAVLEGHGTPSEIEVVTGLTSKQVSSALSYLNKKGLVNLAQVEP